MNDKEYMMLALEEANKAKKQGEVPIGAILVYEDTVIASGYNERETNKNPISHAEIIAIQKGAIRLDNWRLTGCTLYVTIEPCPMCAGAIMNARIDRLVYGAANEKDGAIHSVHHIGEQSVLNHQLTVTTGVCEKECQALMNTFFAQRR